MPVDQTKTNIYSRDRNIWHLSHEGGVLEDPAQCAGRVDVAVDRFAGEGAGQARRRRDRIRRWYAGIGERARSWAPVALIEELNAMAAANGVGRIDLVENRLVGIKSRGAYETPGGTLLVTAHRELEALCLDRETAHYSAASRAALCGNCVLRVVVHGAAGGARRIFHEAQKRVTGTVGLRLYKGNVNVTSRQSPYSLYRTDLASFSMAHYNPKDAEGFINLFALPITPPAGALQTESSGRAPAERVPAAYRPARNRDAEDPTCE